MFNSANVPSLADIAAVTGNNKNDGMWGGDGWWAIIIFAIIFGWNGFGNNGWGGNGGSAGATAAVENFWNVSAQVYIDVPKGCCSTVAVQNTSGQTIEVQNSNLTVVRVA